jgi:hypothetical protein
MFKVVDKKGTIVNIKDEVTYQKMQTDLFHDGETKDVDGIVIALLDETTVQVQPEEGASDTVMASHLTVTGSLINDVEALSTTEDMQKLVYDAEKRYADECEKNGKGGGGGTKTRAPAKKKAQGVMKL